MLLDTKESPQSDNWWNIAQCKLWQPKEGEFVIPKTKTKESFNVFKYSKSIKAICLALKAIQKEAVASEAQGCKMTSEQAKQTFDEIDF